MAGGCEPGFRGAFLGSVERLGHRAVSWHRPSGTLCSAGAACNLDSMACDGPTGPVPPSSMPGQLRRGRGLRRGGVPPAYARSARETLMHGCSQRP